ncbi:MAG: helix-turn-helix domain-containing protein [Clostridiales bacterium]|uniref:helix-turn-helix domain-containing protein n=1 Tax=Flavonifractor porci TaxID=3133422 RepID=UPI003098577D|nr:helix-turn-helix domain-containing protein [Clostridiales bacterium]
MTLGERILNYRKRAGLSQEGLAELLGVSRQAVSKWEGDAAQPELDKIVALAKLFGITTDQLLLGERPDPGLPTEAAPERREPRWYLLGILPLAVGSYLLIRGLLQLLTINGLWEFMKLPECLP